MTLTQDEVEYLLSARDWAYLGDRNAQMSVPQARAHADYELDRTWATLEYASEHPSYLVEAAR